MTEIKPKKLKKKLPPGVKAKTHLPGTYSEHELRGIREQAKAEGMTPANFVRRTMGLEPIYRGRPVVNGKHIGERQWARNRRKPATQA